MIGKDLVMDSIQPVFIVGHPRSGTTFVQLLLAAHPSFSSGPETHFFTYVLTPIRNWKHSKLTKDQVELVFNRLAEKPAIELDNDFKNNIKNEAQKNGITPSILLNEIMLNFSKKSIRWIEKTPRHAQYIPEILEIFPKAKIINIIRDPRSVVSSDTKLENLTDKEKKWYYVKHAIIWNKRIERTKKLISNNERVMSIRYEDIIANPEKMLKEIMSFLGEGFHPNVLETFSKNYNQVTVRKEDSWKDLCSTGEIVDRREIWKKRMSAEDAEIVALVCERLMYEYDYIPKRVSFSSKIKKSVIILSSSIRNIGGFFKEVFNNFITRYNELRSMRKVFHFYMKKLF